MSVYPFEFNTPQLILMFLIFLAGDKQGINVFTIMKLVRTAELSRSEVQNLIDLLLNKQHEAPTVVDEWSEVSFFFKQNTPCIETI